MTDHEHPDDQIEWPREIWMGEREEHDQGVVTAVLSEHATVARWEGDKERDREFHRYVDADIHESAERYYKARIAAAEAAAYRKAAEWHNKEIAKVKSQIDDNNAYARRMRDKGHSCQTTDAANENCRSAIYYLEKSRAAILALADHSALDEALAAEREKYREAIEGLIGYVEGHLDDGCALCGGDCSSANPPVSFCPVRLMMDDVARARAAIRKGDQA